MFPFGGQWGRFSVRFILGLFHALTEGSELEGCDFKLHQNNILDNDGLKYVTELPEKTPQAMEELCKKYSHLSAGDPKDLEDVFKFVLEFICIHPMVDGNGRMSMLLMQFLLTKMGLKCALYLPLDIMQRAIYAMPYVHAIRKQKCYLQAQKNILTFFQVCQDVFGTG